MASIMKWTAPTNAACCHSTDLNALASGSNVVGSAINNSTAGCRHLYADFEAYVGFQGTPAASNYLGLYIVQALDGTNYEDGSGTVDPAPTDWIGNFPCRAAAGSLRVAIRHVLIPMSLFKPMIDNQSGLTLAATTNEIKYWLYSEEVV